MKRKLLCVAVALVMILPLAFAAIPFSNATEFEMGGVADWKPATATSFGTQYKTDAVDGSVEIWYGSAGVTWANCALVYNCGIINGDYTVTGEFMLPELSGDRAQGSAIIAVGCPVDVAYDDGSSVAYQSGWACTETAANLIVYLTDYSNSSDAALAADGTRWNMISYNGGWIPVNCNTGAVYADAAIATQASGNWNTFTIEVTGNYVDIYINGVKIYNDFEFLGNYAHNFCIGTNGDSGVDGEQHTKFRNVVVTNGVNTADYFPSTNTVDLPYNIIQSASGNDPGYVSVAPNGDITLVGDAGWHSGAGISTQVAVPIDGVSVTFNKSVFTDPSPNGYFGIMFSKAKPAAKAHVNFMTRTYAPRTTKANAFMICFQGDSVGAGEYGAVSIHGPSIDGDFIERVCGNDYVDARGEDVTVNISPVYTKTVESAEKKYVRVYINGECSFSGSAESPNYHEIDVTKIVDDSNACYFSLYLQSYGYSSGSVVIKDISYGDDAKTDFTVLGAQYRTTGTPGLRFGSQLSKNLFYDNTNMTYGTLIIPADRVDSPYDLVFTDSGKITATATGETEYLDVVATKFYKESGDMLSFTAVLVGIPDGMEDREFVARAYMKDENGNVIYADPIVRSINGVISATELDAINA